MYLSVFDVVWKQILLQNTCKYTHFKTLEMGMLTLLIGLLEAITLV